MYTEAEFLCMGIEPDAIKKAESAYWQAVGKGSDLKMGLACAVRSYLDNAKRLQVQAPEFEVPLDEKYSDKKHLEIAQAERIRAVAIINDSFNEVDWNEQLQAKEFSLFLALLQHAIEGIDEYEL